MIEGTGRVDTRASIQADKGQCKGPMASSDVHERNSSEARRLEWSELRARVGEEVGGRMGPTGQGLVAS